MRTTCRPAPSTLKHVGAVLLLLAAGCSRPPGQAPHGEVVYASTPVFGFIVQAITGDAFEIRSLLAPGQSPHSFEPRPSDVRDASRARVLVYGSPDLDEWLIAHQEVPRIMLIDLLPDSLKLPPGSQNPNPHFWMDPIAVRALARPLARALCDLDPDRCTAFSQNAELFSSEIDSLHGKVLELYSGKHRPRIVVSHPFLEYFSHRYGIESMNITDGAGGLEPTPRDLSRLIRSVAAGGFSAVVSELGEPSPAARTVAEETGVRLITVDPLGGSPDTGSYIGLVLTCASAIMPPGQ